MRRLFSIVWLFVGCAEAWASSATATLSPPEIPYHLTATLTVSIEAAPDADIDLSALDKLLTKLELQSERSSSLERVDDATERAVFVYTLDAVESKAYAITPIEVTINKSEQLMIPGPTLRVRDLTPEEDTALRFVPNAPPVAVVMPWRRWIWPALGGLLAGLAVAYLLYRRFRRKTVDVPPSAPLRPAWEIALERLQKIGRADWSAIGSWALFYIELSDILRTYLEGRFQIHAPERTTPEFLGEAAQSGALSDEQQRTLAMFLRHSDLVKFAKYEPGTGEMRESFDAVKRFVEETIPQASPEEEEAA